MIGLFATSQPAAAKDYCNDLDDLQASITSLTSLDPATATADEFETDVDAVRNSWTDVKGSAQSLSDVNMDSLDDAWDDFSQTVGSLGGNASVSDAEQAISESADGLQSAVQANLDSYDCSSMAAPGAANRDEAPERAGLVLAALILVAGVANLNLSVANVALPDIGKHFDSSQTTLDLIAVGYSLGLAASVLYLGALGDRYGRKMMLLLGMALSVPACLLAAFAPTDEVLFVARVIGGLSAGMAYPTTLALITALWSGPGRTKSIALWSALGGAIASLGPLVAGALLEEFDWGSVFLITLPLVVVALPMAAKLVPAHVNETTEPVDNLGGILSVVLVAALVLAINFAPVPNKGTLALGLARDRGGRADRLLHPPAPREQPAVRPARRRAPDLLGRGVRGHHRVRLADGRRVHQPAVPAERARLLDARGGRGVPAHDRLHGARRAALGEARREPRGARFTLLCGYVVAAARLRHDAAPVGRGHPVLEDRPRVRVHRHRRRVRRHARLALADRLRPRATRRDGVRHGRPAARPRRRDHAVDLRRAAHRRLRGRGRRRDRRRPRATRRSPTASEPAHEVVRGRGGRRASSTRSTPTRSPPRPRQSFLDGDQWAYTAGIVAVLLGALLVFFMFPKQDEEQQLLAAYHDEDTAQAERRALAAV